MTIKHMQDFNKGKAIWYEYVQLNGYAKEPTLEGLRRLSKILDLNVPYLRKYINLYLES